MGTQELYKEKSMIELLKLYKETGSLEIKQEIVMRYVYLVKSIALQMRDIYLSFVQVDDIINEGVIAIMSAIDKFDIDKNVKFETFISKRIKGMIIDLARKQDWVPRSTRKNTRDIEDAVTTLYNKLGYYPSIQEVTEYLNITPGEIPGHHAQGEPVQYPFPGYGVGGGAGQRDQHEAAPGGDQRAAGEPVSQEGDYGGPGGGDQEAEGKYRCYDSHGHPHSQNPSHESHWNPGYERAGGGARGQDAGADLCV